MRTFVTTLLLVGCTQSVPTVDTDGPPLQQVTVEVGQQLEMHLAGAWLDDDGSGRGVAVEATTAGAPALEISGQRSSWALDKGVVQFDGNVVAKRGAFTLRADSLVVHWKDERIDRAEATGSVVVARGERVAKSRRGVLEGETGKFTLTGAPTITEGGHRMKGDAIVLWLDDERLECNQCVLVLDSSALPAGE